LLLHAVASGKQKNLRYATVWNYINACGHETLTSNNEIDMMDSGYNEEI